MVRASFKFLLYSFGLVGTVAVMWIPETSGVDSSSLLVRPITVAVIDTGADITHPEIANFLWANPGELGVDSQGKDRRSNGLDDDGNGFVDDVNGWNFISKSGSVKDLNGHGTHVAGLIKKTFTEENKNGSPLQLMILKYTDQDGRNSKISFLKAISYAIDMGANLINISASGRGFSKREFDLLKKAQAKGIQVVVATGNKRPNSPNTKTFPASYSLENIHPVAALDAEGNILPSSNQIDKSTVLFALGENLSSALPGNSYGLKTGTSQATALVSGRLAAFLSTQMVSENAEQTYVMNP